MPFERIAQSKRDLDLPAAEKNTKLELPLEQSKELKEQPTEEQEPEEELFDENNIKQLAKSPPENKGQTPDKEPRRSLLFKSTALKLP